MVISVVQDIIIGPQAHLLTPVMWKFVIKNNSKTCYHVIMLLIIKDYKLYLTRIFCVLCFNSTNYGAVFNKHNLLACRQCKIEDTVEN